MSDTGLTLQQVITLLIAYRDVHKISPDTPVHFDLRHEETVEIDGISSIWGHIVLTSLSCEWEQG